MFEEEFDGFGFEFSGESEDGNFYVDSIREFQMLTKFIPLEEVGISFSGEVKVDENTSVITDKQVKMGTPDKAVKTYLKVMEMRELTDVEREKVSKGKLFLKKLFEVFFRGDKWRLNMCIFWVALVSFNIACENYLSALLVTACILLYCSPVKFLKEVKKMCTSKKRKEELSEELAKEHLLAYVNSVSDDEGVQLYFRPKGN